MFNRVFLIGNLTKDAELRYTTSGIAVAKFTIAVNRTFKNREGETEVDFLRIVAWRKLAEICGEYLKKGMMVFIEGRLQFDSFEKDGKKITMTEIIAENMQMLDKKASSAPSNVKADQISNTGKEEVPF